MNDGKYPPPSYPEGGPHVNPMAIQHPGPYPYSPAVVQQPAATHTTVVVTQGGPQQPQMRNWSTGLCGCFEDPLICCCVMCFPDCYGCHLASKAGETCCLPICVPGWMVSLRAHTRGKHNIQGSICNDCCTVACCYPCAICQLSRELDNVSRGNVVA